MSSRNRVLTFVQVAAVSAAIVSSEVSAYTLRKDTNCTSGTHWNILPLVDGKHSCWYTECSRGNVAATERCSSLNTATDREIFAWSAWMWGREDRLRVYLFWDQSHCSNVGFNNDDGTTVWGYQNGLIPGEPEALAAWDYDFDPELFCFTDNHSHFQFGGDFHFRRDSVWENTAATPGNDGNGLQQGILEYYMPGTWKESATLHEMGHFYGLNHETTTLGVMMPFTADAKGVLNIGSQIHIQPDADSVHGASYHHGRNTSNVQNFSGTGWFLAGSVATSDGLNVVVFPPFPATKTVTVTFSLQSFYGGASAVCVPSSGVR